MRSASRRASESTLGTGASNCDILCCMQILLYKEYLVIIRCKGGKGEAQEQSRTAGDSYQYRKTKKEATILWLVDGGNHPNYFVRIPQAS